VNPLTPSERRSRTIGAIAAGLAVLALLTVWTVILRRAPIEDELASRAGLALDQIGIIAADLQFEGRDASLTVEAPLADSAALAVRALEGVRTVKVATIAPPTTTTSTTTTAPTTTTTSTTTTTEAIQDASFTLVSGPDGMTLSGRLAPDDTIRLVEAAAATFGALQVTDAIVSDPGTTRPDWVDPLADALPSLGLVAEPGLAVSGSTLTLAGDIASEERRAAVLTAFESLGLEIGDGLSIAAPPDQGTAAALEAALNAALDDASILFETGSSELSPGGSTQLDEIASLLIAVPGARVEVGGHTDSEGPAAGNLLLSQARADAVAAYLLDTDVDPVQITSVGYGEDQPIADNTTPEGRAANRRIAFTVEGST